MKAKSRFLGIDDAPFRFSDETVPVVGVVVQAPSYIEGVLTTLAEVDGHDATERIAAMVRRSRYLAGFAAILIDGTAVGGFNVVDIDALHEAVDRPVVTVTRKKPNLDSIETALRRRFDDWKERLEIIRPHEILDSGIPHDGIAHEEGLDRAGFDRFGYFGGSVCARSVRRNGLEQRLDEPRLVTDSAVAEHLCAHAGFERLLNPLHPRVGRTVRVDFRSESGLPRFDVVQERVACEPGSHEDERLSDLHHASLREDLVTVNGPGVSRREHLAVTGRADRRQLPNAILAELCEERFFVVQGQEGDEGLLRRSNGLLDPPQLMRLPRLDDGEDVIDRDVQGVMPPEVLRSLDDDAGDS